MGLRSGWAVVLLAAGVFFGGVPPASSQPASLSPPTLAIQAETNSAVQLSWPKAAAAFSLQTTTNFWEGAGWEDADLEVFESQGSLTALQPRDDWPRFFRLVSGPQGTNGLPFQSRSPQLTITQPVVNFAIPIRTSNTLVSLAGTVSDPAAAVLVQDTPATLTGTNWVAGNVVLPQEGVNWITVAASNVLGFQTVKYLTVTRDTTVLQPSGVLVAPTGPNTNRVSWLYSGESDLVGTRVYRRTAGGGSYALIGTVRPPLTFFNDSTVVQPNSYYYQLQAADDLGNLSPLSVEVGPVGAGTGLAPPLALTGGSVDSAGNTSDSVAATSLSSLPGGFEVNGTTFVRYMNNPDSPLASQERVGPRGLPLTRGALQESGYNVLNNFLFENSGLGFGSSLSFDVTLPEGFSWSAPPPTDRIVVTAWGYYPTYGPSFPQSGWFTPANWDNYQALVPVWWDNSTVSVFTTSNRINFFAIAAQQIVDITPDGVTNYSGEPNVFAFTISVLQGGPGGDVVYTVDLDDPTAVIGAPANLQFTINGVSLEAGLGLALDPDFPTRAPLVHPVDDAGGMVDLLSGDYSFQIQLFEGQGQGLNLQGLLHYSSWNTLWDIAAMQEYYPERYAFLPFGPGWGYAYGMRVLSREETVWTNGVAGELQPDELYLVCPDGRVTVWTYMTTISSPAGELDVFSAPSGADVHFPSPEWARFSDPVLVAGGGGYALVEWDPATDGYQEVDFDDQGRVTSIVAPGGTQPVSIQYQGLAQIVTDASGRSARFTYDTTNFYGRVIEIVDPSGGDWRATYSGGALVSLRENATGYGWEFAYDSASYLLTERKLPHGFVIQANYFMTEDPRGYPTNFYKFALESTRWKETPASSTRQLDYARNLIGSPSTPDRVTMSVPSGRNTFSFDTTEVTNISAPDRWPVHLPVSVTTSDQLEGSPGTLRYVSGQSSSNSFQFVDAYINAAGGQLFEQCLDGYPLSLQREDGAVRSWTLSSSNGVTLRAPLAEKDWRSAITNSYRYYDGQTPFERLSDLFPSGQNPSDPAAHRIHYDYDANYRVEAVTDMDSNVTRIVYYNTPGKRGLPFQIVPYFNLSPSVPNPYTWTFDYDGLGRVTYVRDPNQNVTTNVYDPAGRLVQTIGPAKADRSSGVPLTTIEYQGDLVTRVISLTADGQIDWVTYTYDNQMRLIEEHRPGTGPTGQPSTTKYGYDADGNVTNVIYPNLSTASFVYDNRGRLTRSVGPEGEITENDYDDTTDEVTEIRRLDGAEVRRWTIVARDAIRRPTDVLLPQVTQGGTTSRPEFMFWYDEAGGLTNLAYQFAGNFSTTMRQFGLFEEPTQVTTAMGGGQFVVQQLVADYAGRLKQQSGPSLSGSGTYIPRQPNRHSPNVANFSYTCFNAISQVTDLLGNERIKFGFDFKGLLQQVQVPNPAVSHFGGSAAADTLMARFGRDNFGLPSSWTDALGATNAQSRDLLGRVTGVTDALGNQSAISWSSANDPATAVTLANGQTLDGTVAQHNDLGLTTKVSGPGNNGPGVGFLYDESGRLTNTLDAVSNMTAYAYNHFGELVRKTFPSGAYVTYTHDGLGRVTSSTEYFANGSVSRTEIDSYDWHGLLSSAEDDNYRISYTWDELGRLIERDTTFKMLGLTKKMLYQYGEYGDLVATRDDDGYVTQYAWDDQDNLISIRLVSPSGDTEQVNLHPDDVGQLQGWDFQSGAQKVVSTGLAHDQKGRLTGLSFANFGTSLVPLPNLRYDYDARDLVTNVVDYGKRVSAAYRYDPRGFLTSETWSQLSSGTQLYQDQLDYDAAGNRAWRQLNGDTTSYQYDTNYRLKGEVRRSLVRLAANLIQTRADSTNSPAFDSSLASDGQAPDNDSPGAGWQSDTNAVDHWIELDLGAARPIAAVEVSVPTIRGGLQNFRVEVSPSGTNAFAAVLPYQILQGTRVGTNAVATQRHTVRVTFASPQLAGAVRIVVPVGGSGLNPETLAQSSAVLINEVALFERVSQVLNYAYDREGRLTNDGTFSYSYDVQGRLIGVTGPGVSKQWTITPEGLRGSETNLLTGEATYFQNDGPNVYLEFSMTGGSVMPKLRHLNGPRADSHLGFYEYLPDGTGQFRWVLSQAQGSVTQVLDTRGQLLDDRLFGAWGQDLLTPTRGSANLHGFAGARQDPETGHYYARARMYAPDLGRFTSSDPMGMVDGPNQYLFGENSPLNRRDPYGFDQDDSAQPGQTVDEAVQSELAYLDAMAHEHNRSFWRSGWGLWGWDDLIAIVKRKAELQGRLDLLREKTDAVCNSWQGIVAREVCENHALGVASRIVYGKTLTTGETVPPAQRAFEACTLFLHFSVGRWTKGLREENTVIQSFQRFRRATEMEERFATASLSGERALAAEERAMNFSSKRAVASIDSGNVAARYARPVPGGVTIFSEPNFRMCSEEIMTPTKGWFNVGIHGGPMGLAVKEGGQWVAVSPRKLLETMFQNGYRKGMNIRLWACHAGAEEAFTARELHRLTGATVMAPTKVLTGYWSKGNYAIGEFVRTPPTPGMWSPSGINRNNASWRVFNTRVRWD